MAVKGRQREHTFHIVLGQNRPERREPLLRELARMAETQRIERGHQVIFTGARPNYIEYVGVLPPSVRKSITQAEHMASEAIRRGVPNESVTVIPKGTDLGQNLRHALLHIRREVEERRKTGEEVGRVNIGIVVLGYEFWRAKRVAGLIAGRVLGRHSREHGYEYSISVNPVYFPYLHKAHEWYRWIIYEPLELAYMITIHSIKSSGQSK